MRLSRGALNEGVRMSHKKGIYEKYVKRPQDFICALLASVVLSPSI